MTPEKLEKIRRLAEDVRGDPATRVVAWEVLRRYGIEPEPEPTFRDVPEYEDPRVKGARTSPQYDRFKFMDVGAWRKTSNGNPTYLIAIKGVSYRIVLFQHKKTPTWGWMRIDTIKDTTEFSGKFSTLAEAHNAAWTMLMAL